MPDIRNVRAANVALIEAVDSHTEGEPTRIVTSGIPPLPGGTILEKMRYFECHLDQLRRAVLLEPRGHGQVAEVRLCSVELGFTAKGVNQGVPRRASPAVAKTVLEESQRLSKPYGTTLAIEDGVGIIRLRK